MWTLIGGLYATGALFEETAFFDSRRPLVFQTALRIQISQCWC